MTIKGQREPWSPNGEQVAQSYEAVPSQPTSTREVQKDFIAFIKRQKENVQEIKRTAKRVIVAAFIYGVVFGFITGWVVWVLTN